MPQKPRLSGMLRKLATGLLHAVALPAVALLPALGANDARAMDMSGYGVFAWPRWQHGFDFGPKLLGHFGKGESLNAPPGGILGQGSFHIWYLHLVEVHAMAGVGLSAKSFSYGGGLKLNLLESIDDPTGNSISQGFRRGLLAYLIRNFTIFVGLDMIHYKFADPLPGQTYLTEEWAAHPGVGVQWHFYVSNGFARRFYVETATNFATISGNRFALPYLGLGLEFK